jgi:Fur family transcriptional regulator, peroxide stress response regulator
MVQERLTSQKQIILDYLMGVKTHPTAEQVFSEVKRKLPRISRGTVYRVLNSFKDKGEVQTIPVRGIAHFDGDTSPHAHFICQGCSRVYDVFDVCSDCKILKNKKTKVGKINYFKIYFYGKCKKCKK